MTRVLYERIGKCKGRTIQIDTLSTPKKYEFFSRTFKIPSHCTSHNYCHCLRARRPIRQIRPGLISSFRSMRRLGVSILPPGWDASPSQGYPQHYDGTHLYTWVERGTVRVKCLALSVHLSASYPRKAQFHSFCFYTHDIYL